MRLVFAVLALALALVACSSHQRPARHLSATQPAAHNRSYAVPPAIQTQGGLTFHGFACKATCIGHERGYEWAEERDISDPHTCYSRPRLSNPAYESFSEGCEAYVDDSTGAAPLDSSERYSDSSNSDTTYAGGGARHYYAFCCLFVRFDNILIGQAEDGRYTMATHNPVRGKFRLRTAQFII